MSFGGGGFLSSGSKETNTNNYTTVSTETTTTMRDIGLTGANAVELAATLETGSIARDQIRSQDLGVIASVFSNTFAATKSLANDTYVFASEFLKSIGDESSKARVSTESQQRAVLESAKTTAQSLLSESKDFASGGLTNVVKYAFWTIGGLIIVFILIGFGVLKK